MRLLPGQGDLVPSLALSVGDDADLLVLGLQDRPLLDVIFEIGVHLARAHLLLAHPADALQFVAEALALQVGAPIGIVERQFAREHAGRQHGRRKARPFLVRPVGHHDGVLGADGEVVERARHLQARQNAEHAVELAARRLRVEMRADIDRQRVRVRAGARHEHVAHAVDAHLKPRRLAPAPEQMAALIVGVRQRLAVVAPRNARPDLRHLHQRIPQTVRVDAQIFAGSGHSIPSCLARIPAAIAVKNTRHYLPWQLRRIFPFLIELS